jgi:hypothetical protein
MNDRSQPNTTMSGDAVIPTEGGTRVKPQMIEEYAEGFFAGAAGLRSTGRHGCPGARLVPW